MRVTELLIRRQASYEADAGQLRGIVTLAGELGQQTVVLSPGSISRIFEIIKTDIAVKARRQADLSGVAVQEATDEVTLLLESEVK